MDSRDRPDSSVQGNPSAGRVADDRHTLLGGHKKLSLAYIETAREDNGTILHVRVLIIQRLVVVDSR